MLLSSKRKSKILIKYEDSKKKFEALSEKNQEVTCRICLEDLEKNNECKIECCSHRFCYDCIFNWSTKEENLCPLCKQKFNSILKKDENGVYKKIEI